jgi:hypothetical protein
MKHLIYITGILLFIVHTTVRAEGNVPYPTGYRYWTHIKTLTLHKGHPLENPFEGIHHIYANEKGVKGIQTGKYQDGAVIVFDLLENITENKASAEGKRKLIGVMNRDANKYRTTGGWGFEAWNGNQRLTTDKGNSCFACHTSQKDNQFVFSKWRD